MTEYVLDWSTWRCGSSSSHGNKLGEGSTLLLNEEGYQCCLGQFSQQEGVDPDLLLNKESPEGLELNFSETFVYYNGHGETEDTELVRSLMLINDDPRTTPLYKVKRIRGELEKYGHTLKAINQPPSEYL